MYGLLNLGSFFFVQRLSHINRRISSVFHQRASTSQTFSKVKWLHMPHIVTFFTNTAREPYSQIASNGRLIFFASDDPSQKNNLNVSRVSVWRHRWEVDAAHIYWGEVNMDDEMRLRDEMNNRSWRLDYAEKMDEALISGLGTCSHKCHNRSPLITPIMTMKVCRDLVYKVWTGRIIQGLSTQVTPTKW